MTMLFLYELLLLAEQALWPELNRLVLFATWAARAIDGGAHVGTPEHLDTACPHHAACGAALGALRMGVVTYIDPRE